jgi:hypothetical protein
MNTDIKLSLTLAEVNSILQTLGQLPTSSGAWPLLMKVQAQAQSQTMQKEPT